MKGNLMSNRYETEREVQKVYIAYYGRPADPEGQQFWADQLEASGGDLSAIIDAFGDSDEFKAEFGELSIAELVNNLFQQLFGRDADDEGLNFYEDLVTSGHKTLASISLDILNGARDGDATIVEDKLTYVEEFTLKIKVKSKGYGEDVAISVKAKLKSIHGDDESRDDALEELDAFVDDLDDDTTVVVDEEEATEFDEFSDTIITTDEPREITIDEPRKTNILLTDAAEKIVISNPDADVRLFDFGEGDHVVLPLDLLDDRNLESVVRGSGSSLVDLLAAGAAVAGAEDADAAEHIEAFLTASKHHRIKVEIERETENLYSVELRLDTGDGRVRIFDLVLEGSVLEQLGFDLSALDEEEYSLRSHPVDPELIKVSDGSDEDEEEHEEEEESGDESEEEDDSEEDDSEEDDSEEDDSEEDDSEEDDSEEDDSGEDLPEDGLEEPLEEEFIEDAVVELVGYLSGLDVFGFE
jgi:hypothetical protein